LECGQGKSILLHGDWQASFNNFAWQKITSATLSFDASPLAAIILIWVHFFCSVRMVVESMGGIIISVY